MRSRRRRFVLAGLIVVLLGFIAYVTLSGPHSGSVVDEAKQAGREPASFPAADENFFRDMDGGIELAENEIKGRNMWLVWAGGEDRFWGKVIEISFCNFDLFKNLSSYSGLKNSPDNTLGLFGLIHEPCLIQA